MVAITVIITFFLSPQRHDHDVQTLYMLAFMYLNKRGNLGLPCVTLIPEIAALHVEVILNLYIHTHTHTNTHTHTDQSAVTGAALTHCLGHLLHDVGGDVVDGRVAQALEERVVQPVQLHGADGDVVDVGVQHADEDQ